jgi:hypothetical protein
MYFPFNTSRIIFMALNCLIPLIWFTLSAIVLFDLRKKSMLETARVLWVMLVVCMPILGAIAYWIVRPAGNEQGPVG